MKLSILMVVAGLISLNCARNDATISKDLPAGAKPGPIVRLHFASTGRFFCSGTIISNTRLLTAGHCVAAAAGFMGIAKDSIEVRSANGVVIDVAAQPLAADDRTDQGMVSGNFTSAIKATVVSDSKRNIDLWNEASLVNCGYPFGGALFCTPVKNPKYFSFSWKAKSYLYPGMSGGPVFDKLSGLIVGINSAAMEEYDIFATTLEIFSNLKVSLE